LQKLFRSRLLIAYGRHTFIIKDDHFPNIAASVGWVH
jgi:hypothetical protein